MTTKQLTYQSSDDIITALEDSSFQTLMGENIDGETILATLIDDPTLEDNYSITTYQTNGHVRINYYNDYGNPTGETYEGRWKQHKHNRSQTTCLWLFVYLGIITLASEQNCLDTLTGRYRAHEYDCDNLPP